MNILLFIYCIVCGVVLYFYSIYYHIGLPNHQYLEGVALIIAWPVTAVILFIKHLYKGIVKLIKN